MTAIRATFSQYAMVKTRGVLVLHMEVPLEQQAEVFKVLGYPLPGEKVWCGIARLKPETRKEVMPDQSDHNATPPETGAVASVVWDTSGVAGPLPPWQDRPMTVEDSHKAEQRFLASERGKAAYAAASDMEKARLRSVLLAKDIRFRDWLGANDEANAAHLIRIGCCAGESRRLIAEDEACYRAFLAMEGRYMEETGLMVVPR